MKNSILIGSTGFLGSYIAEEHSPRICNLRFEDSEDAWHNYAAKNSDADSVILLSRTCRKTNPRRDRDTMLNEVSGISKILKAFSNQHFIFSSTKVVYGLTDNDVRFISRKKITDYFVQSLSGQFINTTVDLPDQIFDIKDIEALGKQHQTYAYTKLCNEMLIKQCAKSYTIFRIWDIIL